MGTGGPWMAIVPLLLSAMVIAILVALRARRAPAADTARADADPGPQSALGAALAAGDDAAVRALLASGTDPNLAHERDLPALHVAAARSRASVIPDLVAAGAAVDFADPVTGSALTVPIAGGDVATVDALLRAGVPLDVTSETGAHALSLAALVGNRAIVERLLAAGADVDRANFQGGTALRSAAQTGHADIVSLLMVRGANPAPVDDFDKRPIDYAREGGHRDVVALLEGRAARTTTATARRTPIARTLPPRRDASLKAVLDAQQQGGKPRSLGLSSLEAPSALAAVHELAPGIPVSFKVVETPDPRLPLRPVGLQLWSYERGGQLTNDARPTVPRPADAIVDAVRGVAAIPYHLQVWSAAAARAAKGLGEIAPHDVLAVMVHPPNAPPNIATWIWRFRVQVAAALVASHLDGSRATLEDVVDGPADWTGVAAIVALFDLARRDAAAREAVVATLLRVARRDVDPPAFQNAIHPATVALLELGGLGDAVTRELEERIRGAD